MKHDIKWVTANRSWQAGVLCFVGQVDAIFKVLLMKFSGPNPTCV